MNSSGWRYWGLVVATGLIVGAISTFIPLGKSDGSIPVGLTKTTRAEQVKEMEALRLQAIREAAEGKYAESISTLLRLHWVNPHDPFSTQRMASILKEMGEQKFLITLDTALSDRPDNSKRSRIVANVYYHAHENSKGETLIDEFIKDVDENDLAAQFIKGAFVRRRGENQKAVDILNRVIEIEPTHYYAYLELQQAYDDLDDVDNANMALGLALRNSPANKEGVCCGLPLDATAAGQEKG